MPTMNRNRKLTKPNNKITQWKNSKGEVLDIAEMNTMHLRNTINLIKRVRQHSSDVNAVLQLASIFDAELEKSFIENISARNHKIIRLCKKALSAMEKELDTRIDEGDLL